MPNFLAALGDGFTLPYEFQMQPLKMEGTA